MLDQNSLSAIIVTFIGNDMLNDYYINPFDYRVQAEMNPFSNLVLVLIQ